VSTDHGKEDIGKLHVGDKVLAYNPKTHKMEWQPILHVWKHTDHDLIDLTITTAAKGQRGMSATKTNEVVHTTSEHPFFATEQGFVPAGKVHVGLHVLRADGSMGVITGWKVAPGTQVMYNLEVANDHTFTVGVGQWVVHNRCDRTKLRANLGLLTGDPRVAQHVIPCELENDPLVVLSGLDINSATNGRIVYTDTAAAQGNDEIYHSGSHASYTSYVQFLLTRRRAELTAAGNLTQPSAMKKILDTIRDANANIAGLNIEAANSSIPLRLC